jgi:hypothetical protein
MGNLKMDINIKTVKSIMHAAPTYVVFGAAAYQSFWHSIHVALAHGASDPWLVPVSIDGVLITASRYVSHARTRAARVLAFAVMIVGMAATLGVNALAAPRGDWVGLMVAVWPGVGMILTAALIHWAPQRATSVRRRRPVAKNVRSITSAKKRTA